MRGNHFFVGLDNMMLGLGLTTRRAIVDPDDGKLLWVWGTPESQTWGTG